MSTPICLGLGWVPMRKATSCIRSEASAFMVEPSSVTEQMLDVLQHDTDQVMILWGCSQLV